MQKISKCRNKHNSTRTNLLREAMCGTQHVQIFGTLEHTLCWTLWGQSLWICVSSKNRKDSRRQVAYNGCIHESLITIKINSSAYFPRYKEIWTNSWRQNTQMFLFLRKSVKNKHMCYVLFSSHTHTIFTK